MGNTKKYWAKLLVIMLLLSTILSVNITVQAEGIPVNGLVAHYKFDSDIKDSSGQGNDGTAIGRITYKDAVLGKGAIFDGESYIEVEDNDSLDLMEGYTISAWIYKEDVRPSSEQPIVRKTGNILEETWSSYEFADRDFELCEAVYTEYENYDSFYSKARVDFHKWTLVSVSYDKSSVRFYINGALTASEQVKGTIPESEGKLQIGFSEYDGSSFFKGVMDDLRIYDRVLTPTEVKALYSAGTTGSGKDLVIMPKKLVALYSFNGNVQDSSGFENHGEIVGNISYVDGKAGKAAKFDDNSMIEVKDSDALDLTEGYTFSLWMYLEDDAEIQEQPVLMKSRCSTNEDEASYIFGINDFEPYVQVYTEYQNYDRVMSGTLHQNGKWTMLTVSYDGKEVKYYKDGVLAANKSSVGSVPASSGKLYIGFDEFDGSSFFKGIMDELRIYNYALSAAEVKALYSPAPAASTGTPSSWAVPEIDKAQELNLTTERILSNYQTNITREEFCELAVKLYEALSGKQAETGASNPFTDTANPEILKAYNLKIVNGTSADKFSPSNPVTRQEICVMIVRTIQAAKPGLDTIADETISFADEAAISNWAKDAVKFLNKNEIIKGTGTTTISIAPRGNTTREQAVVLIKRTFESFSRYTWVTRPEGGGEWKMRPEGGGEW